MEVHEWRKAIGDIVREHSASDVVTRYFDLKQTPLRAQVIVRELAHFIRHRRDCWAHVSGNCPVWSVKQKILQHEYGEVIKDEFSEHGHITLILNQGKTVGLQPEDILNADPLPTTRAVLYAWGWITREKPWLEGLQQLSDCDHACLVSPPHLLQLPFVSFPFPFPCPCLSLSPFVFCRWHFPRLPLPHPPLPVPCSSWQLGALADLCE